MTGTGSLRLKGEVARREVWTNVDPSAALERQIEAIGKNVDRLRGRLNELQEQLDKRFREHAEALDHETITRAQDDEHLRNRLEAAETGGLHITFAGVVWLLVGVLFATLPQEILGWTR
jgi:chromosome segregation ATPase